MQNANCHYWIACIRQCFPLSKAVAAFLLAHAINHQNADTGVLWVLIFHPLLAGRTIWQYDNTVLMTVVVKPLNAWRLSLLNSMASTVLSGVQGCCNFSISSRLSSSKCGHWYAMSSTSCIQFLQAGQKGHLIDPRINHGDTAEIVNASFLSTV